MLFFLKVSTKYPMSQKAVIGWIIFTLFFKKNNNVFWKVGTKFVSPMVHSTSLLSHMLRANVVLLSKVL